MRHPDPETLALRALGEQVLDDDGEAHVVTCPTCRHDLDGLLQTTIALRRAVHGGPGGPASHPATPLGVGQAPAAGAGSPAGLDMPEIHIDMDSAVDASSPPPHVWAAIARELGLDPDLAPGQDGGRRQDPPSAPPPVERPDGTGTPAPGLPPPGLAVVGPAGRDDLRPRRARAHRRPRRMPGLLAAAAAGALVAGAGGSALTALLLGEGADEPARTQVLAAALAPVEGSAVQPSGGGDAAVVRAAETPDAADDRRVELEIDVSGLPEAPGYHGVWLIDPDSGDMVAVGVLPDGAQTASFTLPEGLDLGVYALVDVSDEPLDGDPTHSGVSLLRGTLSA